MKNEFIWIRGEQQGYLLHMEYYTAVLDNYHLLPFSDVPWIKAGLIDTAKLISTSSNKPLPPAKPWLQDKDKPLNQLPKTLKSNSYRNSYS